MLAKIHSVFSIASNKYSHYDEYTCHFFWNELTSRLKILKTAKDDFRDLI